MSDSTNVPEAYIDDTGKVRLRGNVTDSSFSEWVELSLEIVQHVLDIKTAVSRLDELSLQLELLNSLVESTKKERQSIIVRLKATASRAETIRKRHEEVSNTYGKLVNTPENTIGKQDNIDLRLSKAFVSTDNPALTQSAKVEYYYTYTLRYPDGTPFYVGKGTGDRVSQHVKEFNSRANGSTKHRVIGDILFAGLQVIEHKEVENLPEQAALDFEKVLIGHLKNSHLLTNAVVSELWSENLHREKLEFFVGQLV